MRYTIIDEDQAPPRPMFKRGNQLSLEMDALVRSLEPDQVARIPQNAKFAPTGLRVAVSEAASRRGCPVDIWEADGVVYAALAEDGSGRERE